MLPTFFNYYIYDRALYIAEKVPNFVCIKICVVLFFIVVDKHFIMLCVLELLCFMAGLDGILRHQMVLLRLFVVKCLFFQDVTLVLIIKLIAISEVADYTNEISDSK